MVLLQCNVNLVVMNGGLKIKDNINLVKKKIGIKKRNHKVMKQSLGLFCSKTKDKVNLSKRNICFLDLSD